MDISQVIETCSRGKGRKIYSFICGHCGDDGYRTDNQGSDFCSPACYYKNNIGSNNKRYTGGRSIKNGYVRIREPKSAYIMEHRIVMEEFIGRKLVKGETVHHKNGIRHDNRMDNLELWVKPQVPGQRAWDLVLWVVNNYRNEVKALLECEDLAIKLGQEADGDLV